MLEPKTITLYSFIDFEMRFGFEETKQWAATHKARWTYREKKKIELNLINMYE